MPVLPDVLEPGLKVVFVGTAASTRSAAVGAPYAGPGNRFWDILHETGLTPHRLDPQDFATITAYGLGLTGMAPNAVGNDDVLGPDDFDAKRLRAVVERYQPAVVAFVGKRAAQEFFGRTALPYGQQEETHGATRFWVLPSTSGAARRYWDPDHWHGLAAFLRNQPQTGH